MTENTLEVPGTVQPDGTLVLDKKLALPAGRVRVTVTAVPQPNPANAAEHLAIMEQIWADQKARGHIPRTREQIDAETA